VTDIGGHISPPIPISHHHHRVPCLQTLVVIYLHPFLSLVLFIISAIDFIDKANLSGHQNFCPVVSLCLSSQKFCPSLVMFINSVFHLLPYLAIPYCSYCLPLSHLPTISPVVPACFIFLYTCPTNFDCPCISLLASFKIASL
jgi:hypothetical protein